MDIPGQKASPCSFGCLIFSSSLQIWMSVCKIHHHVAPILSAPMPWAPTAVAARWAFVRSQKAPGNMATSAANVIISLCVLAMKSVSCSLCPTSGSFSYFHLIHMFSLYSFIHLHIHSFTRSIHYFWSIC